ncbi:hypothetical protein JJD41_16135 [Oxynema sp. CENA135]|uniref:hypothetical protein n=1 Tax=Oxynema sp. CENA135 TaxID=984206 RepID=UPI0019097D89|nr:hypothetical protein [Oxynema sp. CENA135]MBK4731379.1 hypothetical protein [Oxynema sp. CENA135]
MTENWGWRVRGDRDRQCSNSQQFSTDVEYRSSLREGRSRELTPLSFTTSGHES